MDTESENDNSPMKIEGANNTKARVLDCTIRDGGLMNSSRFPDSVVRAVYDCCADSGVEYMEIGYKNSKKIFSKDEYGAWKFCDEDDILRILGDSPRNVKLSVMADAEKSDYKQDIKDSASSPITLVRVACYSRQIPVALDMIKDAKDKGYEVSVNLMAACKLSLRQFSEDVMTLANSEADIFYLMDSFGSFYCRQVAELVKMAGEICHSRGCRLLVDGAQGAVHGHPDLKDLDCDFYAFSGHKMYAAPGTGVLYGKKKLLDAMPPYMGGGEMVGSVKWSGTTYAPVPLKFEAGTQNFAGAPTMVPAIRMLELMEDAEIERNIDEITAYLLEELPKIPGLRLYGIPGEAYGQDFRKIPLFSFSVEHCHHEDLALILDKMGIALRSGQMCAEPLMDRFGVTGMLRASFAPYNTMEETGYFLSSLKKAIKMLEA